MAAGLGEGQIAEFVEDDDVEAGQIIGDAVLPPGAGFRFKAVDEIDGGEEAPARAGANAAAGDGDREMRLARAARGRDMAPDFWRAKRLFTTPSIL